jgi:agmatine/peptidylarginine deiminase
MSNRCLPAEWEPQAGVMLTWPHINSDWRSSLLNIEPVFVNLACEISKREKLLIVALNLDHQEHIKTLLNQAEVNNDNVVFVICGSNDSWARDHGPITILENNQAQLLDFSFNGWGDKYPFYLDNAITGHLFKSGLFGKTPVDAVELILEGGSIDSDGAGSLMVTSRCLLHPKRNPGKNQQQLEKQLTELLGTKHFLWLEHGVLAGDDTDGHIDMLARFASPDTIIYQSCTETAYPYFAELNNMQAELERFVQADGQPYRLVALPWPAAQVNSKGDCLPLSYANFLLINQAVLVPAYMDDADEAACEVIQSLFLDREIVSINCCPLIEQFGSLHCATMQFPEGVDLG